MRSYFPQEAASIVQEHKSDRRRAVVFVCLAVIVALVTMLGLRMYGHAMTRTVRVFECTVAPHTHTEACYVTVDGQKILNCGEADFLVHAHNYDCYNDNGELVCQLPEIRPHTHTADCWQVTKTLTCPLPEAPAHTHTEACYGDVRDLVCGLEEVAPHYHTEECYTTTTTLTCGLEEHTHTDACYTADPVLTCAETEHTHNETCFDDAGNVICGLNEHTHTDGCYNAEPVLTCTLPEHTHGVECYTTEQVLTCTLPETEGHTHTDACYALVNEPICGLAEGEGHTHTDACYTEQRTLICPEREAILHTHTEECWTPVDQLNAMTEDELAAIGLTPADLPALRTTIASDGVTPIALTCGQPQVLEHMHTEEAGCYRTERIDVADAEPAPETETEPETICGLAEHTHTDECFDETGALICGLEAHTHTDACYPAADPDTAGTPAGDELATAETAGTKVPATPETAGAEAAATPETAGSGSTAADGQTFCGMQEHTHTDACYTFNKLYTCGQEEDATHTHNDTCFYYEKVLSCTLPEHTHTAECYVDPAAGPDLSGYSFVQVCDLPDGSMRVTVAYNEDAQLPENAMLIASLVTGESSAELIDQAKEVLSESDVAIDEAYAPVVLDIGFYADGEEVEPAAPVFVTVQMLNADRLPEGKPISVVHFPDNAAPEVMQGTDLTGGATSFTSESFSRFSLLPGFGEPIALAGNTVLAVEKETAFAIPNGHDLDPYVTDAKITDSNNHVLEPGDNVVLGDKYTYSVKFQESGDRQFTTPMYFQLPEGFKATPVEGMELYFQGQKVGTYSVNADGLVTLDLDENYIRDHDDVWVALDFNLVADGSKDGDTLTFPWDGGKEQTFNVMGTPVVQLNKKAGEYDPAGHTIDYTVTLDVTDGIVKDTVITDVMEKGVSLLEKTADGKTAYTITVTDENGNVLELDPAPTLEKTENCWVTKNLPETLLKGQKVVIEYKSVVEFDENGANLQFADGETRFHFAVDNTAAVDCKPAANEGEVKGTTEDKESKTVNDKQLEKDGSLEAGNTIDWEIAVGTGSFDVRGQKLQDTMEGSGQWIDTNHPLEIKWKDASDNTIKTKTIQWALKPDGTVDTATMEKEGITNIKQDGNGNIISFDITIPDAQNSFWNGSDKDAARRWTDGDWVKVEYFTKYDPPADGTKVPYTNKVTGLTETIPDGVDGEIVVGSGGIMKELKNDVRDGVNDYIEYTVTVQVPPASTLRRMENSEKEPAYSNDELPYFYLQDQLEFPHALIKGDGSTEEVRYFVDNVPEIVGFKASSANGEYNFVEYSDGLGSDAYSYRILHTSGVDKSTREFQIWFNSNWVTEKEGDYHDSVWPIDEEVTLTITYRIPGNSPLVREDGSNYTPTNFTLRDLLETGNRLDNEIWGHFRHEGDKKLHTEVETTKTPNDVGINKSAQMVDDNTIQYYVTFDNAYHYKDELDKGHDKTLHTFTQDEVDSFYFIDDFDARLDFVSGSLEVVLLDGSGSDRGIYAVPVEQETGDYFSITPGAGNTKRLQVSAKAFTTVKQNKYLHDRNSLCEYLKEQQTAQENGEDPTDTRYIFRYQLRINEQYMNGDELVLPNTAHVKYGSTDLQDDAVVKTTPNVLTKSSSQQMNGTQGTNVVDYTIVVNPGAVNLAVGTAEDGSQTDLERYTLTDTMGEGMTADWTKVKITYTDRNGNTGDLTRAELPSEVTLTSYTYALLPVEGNGLAFVVPDELALTITYPVTLDVTSGSFTGSNSVKLEGNKSITSENNATFDVKVSGGSTGATDNIYLYKRDADTRYFINGAEFTLYSASGTGDPATVTAGSTSSELKAQSTPYAPTTHVDTATGRAGARIPITNDDKGDFFVLVESKAPAGYAPTETPTVFKYGTKQDGDPDTVTVTVNGKEYKDVTVQYLTGGEGILVDNTSIAFELPETGGSGTLLFTLSGLMLLLGAALVYRTFAGRRREHV